MTPSIRWHPNIRIFSTFHSTAGYDYEAGPYTVSFAAGQMYATLMIPTLDDNTTELSEYFKVVINSTDRPDLAEIGYPNMSLITIQDNDPGTVASIDFLAVTLLSCGLMFPHKCGVYVRTYIMLCSGTLYV